MKTSRVLRLIQWIFSIGSFILILRMIDLDNFLQIFISFHKGYLAFALICALASFAVGAWRWQQLLLMISGRSFRWKYLFDSYIESFFVSSVLPGSITGDVLRAFDTRSIATSSATSAFVVTTERALGFFILALLGSWSWLNLKFHPEVYLKFSYISALIVLIIFICIVFLAIFHSRKTSIKSLPFIEWLRQFWLLLVQLPYLSRRKPGLSLRILLSTILYQMLALFIVFIALRAAYVPISLTLFLAIAPIVTILITIPISIQGVGVRESLYLAFLIPQGINANSLIAGLTLTYLIGFPFIFWGWILFNHRARGYRFSE